MSNLLLATAVGIGGTVFMDLWSVLLNRVFAIAPPNWGLVGRGIPFKTWRGFSFRYSNRARNGW